MSNWLACKVGEPRTVANVRVALRTNPLALRFAKVHTVYLAEGSCGIGRRPLTSEQHFLPGEPITIDDQRVSAQHAMLHVGSTSVEIEDRGSTNGTFVNGFRISRTTLQDGDCVTFHSGDHLYDQKFLWVYIGQSITRIANETTLRMPHAQFRTSMAEILSHRDHWIKYQQDLLRESVIEKVQVPRGNRHRNTQEWEHYITEVVHGILPPGARAYRSQDSNQLHLVFPASVDRTASLERIIFALDAERVVPNIDTTGVVSGEIMLRESSKQTPPDIRWRGHLFHLSDIHVRIDNRDPAWQRERERIHYRLLESLINSRVTEPAWVLASGDLAYQGKPIEYQKVLGVLAEIAAAVGVQLDRVRVVPGNHDVDRDIAHRQLGRALHAWMRAKALHRDHAHEDEEYRGHLLRKLAAFYDTLVGQLPGHPREPDWREELAPEVSLLGLNTVWVSDDQDTNRALDNAGGNLLVSQRQLSALIPPGDRCRLRILLAHHPLEWLSQESQEALINAASDTPLLYLCGHIHALEATVVTRIGMVSKFSTFNAGAAHLARGEAGRHSYHQLTVELRGNEIWLGWSPRVYEADSAGFRIDRTRVDGLDEMGFVWTRLDSRYAGAGPSTTRAAPPAR